MAAKTRTEQYRAASQADIKKVVKQRLKQQLEQINQ